ncbi:hypothetical protein CG740_38650 [Streptomyces sp. CB01201]|nr:hypothetical protein CG740_38650 [Streptomyces sp. CB01201]
MILVENPSTRSFVVPYSPHRPTPQPHRQVEKGSVKPLIGGFSTEKSVSTRGFLRLSTRQVWTCPVLPCASCPPSSASTAGSLVPAGGA